MCECQTCGADENENDLNEWGECWKCADVIDTLIESVCDGKGRTNSEYLNRDRIVRY